MCGSMVDIQYIQSAAAEIRRRK